MIQTKIVIINAKIISISFTGQEFYFCGVFLVLSMLHAVPVELEIVKVEIQLRLGTVKLDSCHRFIDQNPVNICKDNRAKPQLLRKIV